MESGQRKSPRVGVFCTASHCRKIPTSGGLCNRHAQFGYDTCITCKQKNCNSLACKTQSNLDSSHIAVYVKLRLEIQRAFKLALKETKGDPKGLVVAGPAFWAHVKDPVENYKLTADEMAFIDRVMEGDEEHVWILEKSILSPDIQRMNPEDSVPERTWPLEKRRTQWQPIREWNVKMADTFRALLHSRNIIVRIWSSNDKLAYEKMLKVYADFYNGLSDAEKERVGALPSTLGSDGSGGALIDHSQPLTPEGIAHLAKAWAYVAAGTAEYILPAVPIKLTEKDPSVLAENGPENGGKVVAAHPERLMERGNSTIVSWLEKGWIIAQLNI